MSTNEKSQGNQTDGNSSLSKEQAVHTQETIIPDGQVSDKFPKWDILPPHQFINPRVKKAE
jgi:hypothetical protein